MRVLRLILAVIVSTILVFGALVLWSLSERHNRTVEVEYNVTGTVDQAFITYTNTHGVTEQHAFMLPWIYRFPAAPGQHYVVSAVSVAEAGTLTCSIRIDGIEQASDQTDTVAQCVD